MQKQVKIQKSKKDMGLSHVHQPVTFGKSVVENLEPIFKFFGVYTTCFFI